MPGGRARGSRALPGPERESALAAAGCWPVAGIDEAGRGPLAGPVCAAAVVLDLDRVPAGLDDSKRLAAAKREALFDGIVLHAAAVAFAFAGVAEIDRLGIRLATHLAMRRSLAALAVAPRHLLLDGDDCPAGLACPAEAVVGGDGLHASIAAASIVAKVARDRLMRTAHHCWPGYGFDRHVGYGTAAHLAALAAHGPCPLHRRSFAPVRRLARPGVLSEKNTAAIDQP